MGSLKMRTTGPSNTLCVCMCVGVGVVCVCVCVCGWGWCVCVCVFGKEMKPKEEKENLKER